MNQYNIIVSTSEATVVSEYEPQVKRSDAYQSEAELEDAFIKMLTEQGYEYVTIHKQFLVNWCVIAPDHHVWAFLFVPAVFAVPSLAGKRDFLHHLGVA